MTRKFKEFEESKRAGESRSHLKSKRSRSQDLAVSLNSLTALGGGLILFFSFRSFGTDNHRECSLKKAANRSASSLRLECHACCSSGETAPSRKVSHWTFCSSEKTFLSSSLKKRFGGYFDHRRGARCQKLSVLADFLSVHFWALTMSSLHCMTQSGRSM